MLKFRRRWTSRCSPFEMNSEEGFIEGHDEKLICTLLQASRMVVPILFWPGLSEW